MNLPPAKVGMAILAVALGFCLMMASPSQAQLMQNAGGSTKMQNLRASQDQLSILQDVDTHSPIDPKETDAYRKFFQVPSQNADKKIKLGTAFLQRYPKSVYVEAVDVGLTNAYLAKQDWKNFYNFANQALAKNPNEVDVLTTVGWVIPHQFDPNGASSAQQLQTAEADEKHALDLLSKMHKPKGVSGQQFAAMKTQKSQQAHSALGLVYFRRGDYADSVKELQQSTQGSTGVDETDLFVLGVDLQNLKRHADAAKAFARCSEVAGPLQARCKQSANQESHLAGGGQ
jgi:tetratricopeptide (TPR) repeat protein